MSKKSESNNDFLASCCSAPEPKPIYIIDDDSEIIECIEIAARQALTWANLSVSICGFTDALAAITAIDQEVPALIFLDVLLTGPNGFTFLNELASYTETARIPIIITSSLDLTNFDLSHYGVVKILSKESMSPSDIMQAVQEFYIDYLDSGEDGCEIRQYDKIASLKV